MFDGRAAEPTKPPQHKPQDPTISPERRLAMLVMAAMRKAKERGFVADPEVDGVA